MYFVEFSPFAACPVQRTRSSTNLIVLPFHSRFAQLIVSDRLYSILCPVQRPQRDCIHAVRRRLHKKLLRQQSTSLHLLLLRRKLLNLAVVAQVAVCKTRRSKLLQKAGNLALDSTNIGMLIKSKLGWQQEQYFLQLFVSILTDAVKPTRRSLASPKTL